MGLPVNRPLGEERQNQWGAPLPRLTRGRSELPTRRAARPSALEILEELTLERVVAVPGAGRETPHPPRRRRKGGSFGRTRPRRSWRPRWTGARPNVAPSEEHRNLPADCARGRVAPVASPGPVPGSPQGEAAFGAGHPGDLFRSQADSGHRRACPRTRRSHRSREPTRVGLMVWDGDERSGPRTGERRESGGAGYGPSGGSNLRNGSGHGSAPASMGSRQTPVQAPILECKWAA